MREKRERRPSEGRMSVTLRIGHEEHTVHFLDISRLDDSWLIDCAIDGPRRRHVTIRATADPHVGVTAQRVLGALRDWLLSNDEQEYAFLELPPALEPAS